MSRFRLLIRTIWYFYIADMILLFAAAVGAAAITGSFVVGDSVRYSLRNIVEKRLGGVEYVLTAPHFFTDTLDERLQALAEFAGAYRKAEALIATTGSCTKSEGGAYAARVNVFGSKAVQAGTCVVSQALARQMDAKAGDSIVLHVNPLNYGAEVLPAGADRTGVGLMRLKVFRVAESGGYEDAFSFYGGQRPVRNMWVPLAELQSALEVPGEANTLFVFGQDEGISYDTARLEEFLRKAVVLEDYGLRLKETPMGELSLESRQFLIPGSIENIILKAFPQANGVFAYIANTIRDADTGRECPYSMVAGIGTLAEGKIREGAAVLNRWAADDLGAAPGHKLQLVTLVRSSNGLFEEKTFAFTVERIIQTEGVGADASLVPEYKMITGAESLAAWKPPRDFNFHAGRIRAIDEEYWERYRAAPKVFINLGEAQRIWGMNIGRITSIRFAGEGREKLGAAILEHITPATAGLVFRPIRAEQLRAADGNTDFSQLFLSLSFFIVVSAVLLIVLVTLLSVEQRSRQIGVMFAMGFTTGDIRRLFLAEGALVLLLGSVLGAISSAGYAWLMLAGLRTIWNDALGTRFITLSVTPATIAIGCAAGFVAGIPAVWFGIRDVGKMSVTDILYGRKNSGRRPQSGSLKSHIFALAAFLAASAVGVTGLVYGPFENTAVFFAAGICLLAGFLAVLRGRLIRVAQARQTTASGMTLYAAGVRNAARNLTRSMLTAGLLAAATFILVLVTSMRTGKPSEIAGNGIGGYAAVAEFDVPLPYDLNEKQGRLYLGLGEDEIWQRVRFVNMRTNSGEDISCRNLYSPANPRIVSVPPGRLSWDFPFAASVEGKADPWNLLDITLDNGDIPAIADVETARWILHKRLGDSVEVTDERGAACRLRIVAFLKKSIFQGELLIGEWDFERLYPKRTGYGQILIAARAKDVQELSERLRRGLADFGATVESVGSRMASFERIADAYLSAFRVLGGFGLLTGTLGLLLVLVRGVMEKRSEIALMSALGFSRGAVAFVVAAENSFLLIYGMIAGTVSALAAAAPEFAAGHGRLSSVAEAVIFPLATAIFAGVLLVWISAALVRRITPSMLRVE